MGMSNQCKVRRSVCDRPVPHILYMGLRPGAGLGTMVVTSSANRRREMNRSLPVLSLSLYDSSGPWQINE